MLALCCTECGRRASQGNGLFVTARYPSLRVCWMCVRGFQRWVTLNMGYAYLHDEKGIGHIPKWLYPWVIDNYWYATETSATLIPNYKELDRHEPAAVSEMPLFPSAPESTGRGEERVPRVWAPPKRGVLP